MVDCLLRLCSKRDRVYLQTKTREEKAEMCFNHLDANHDKYLTFEEFMATEIELTPEAIAEVRDQFQKIDFDGNKKLTLSEYVEAFMSMTQMHSDESFDLLVTAILESKPHSEAALAKAGVVPDESSSEDEAPSESRAERKARKKKEKKKAKKLKSKQSIDALVNGHGTDLATRRNAEGREGKKHKKKKDQKQ